MKSIKTIAAILSASCLFLPLSAPAQRAGEMTFYSDIGFRGRSYTVTGPRENINVPFTVRSARVSPGDSWQICTRTSYRGSCNTVDTSQGNIAWTVASARPTRPSPGAPGREQSLRGMSAQFFVQPTNNGRRVESCASGAAACAATSADRFCQSRSWTASSYERQETVGGRNYLADVLCTRTR